MAGVMAAHQVVPVMPWLTKRTLPSPRPALMPPVCGELAMSAVHTALSPWFVIGGFACAELGKRLPDNAIVSCDSGTISTWWARHIPVKRGQMHSVSGTLATIIGIGTLLLTATGAFGEIQTSLNAIWKAEPSANLSQLVRARLLSLGLVVTLGFLMLVSLAVSAALTALGDYLNSLFPAGHLLMSTISFVISLTLIAVLFAVIYKVLPEKPIAWRDVVIGAVVTALLFTIGKSVIGLYIGSSNVASSYGAAGALLIILLWVYYSAQIFLLGAEFTRAYAERHGSHASEHQSESGSTSSATAGLRPRTHRRPAAGVSTKVDNEAAFPKRSDQSAIH